ncbi:MAG: hypothetical protein J6U68_01460, partial [Clostridia bacterium]|nr:hypothetical protein [Clostridia bacterium]
LEDLQAEYIKALGTKLANSNSKYTSDSYSAYSAAYEAIVAQINSATSTDALESIDVAALRTAAESKLVLTVDKMKADLKAELGDKKSNSSGEYTSASYSSYTTAYNAILTQIDSATTVAELNAIDIATLKANAEAMLRSTFQDTNETMIATLGTKKEFSAALYTRESYEEYSTAFVNILSDINSATTVAELNAIGVEARKAAAEALLKEPIIEKDTITSLGASVSKDLEFYYSGNTSTEPVYSVDVTWDDISFTYTGGSAKWNPASHAYDNVTSDAKWSDASGSVLVKNHSNASVDVEITFEPLSTANGTANLTVNGGSFTLSSAVAGSAYTSAPAQTATITASGVPSKSGSVGKIKVKISSK